MMSPNPAETPPPAWTPLLTGQAYEAALQALDDIAADLARWAEAPGDAREESPASPGRLLSLAGGEAGIALFFAYLDRAFPDRGHDDTALLFLERAVEGVGEEQTQPSLYSGFSGVAWVLEHLQGTLLEPGDEDPGEDVATALAGMLGQSPWPGEYDLIGGLVGYGVYGLERLPRSGGIECLGSAVARLGELAERPGDGPAGGLTWRTPRERISEELRDRCPEGNFNLGVAHGMPGAVALLGAACAAGLEEEARPLLDGAILWMLGQRLPPGAGSHFPSVVAPGLDSASQGPSRAAWCYGDPGIAAALLAAGRAAGEPAWEREALAIAAAAAVRPVETAGVVDVGLCHGAAGLAHLFNRFWQAGGDPACAAAARFWLGRALEMRRPGEGIGGFLAWLPDAGGELAWRADPGFLTGAAGIGLALLAAVSPVAPGWDRVLQISTPGH
jgi:hypothetical protein